MHRFSGAQKREPFVRPWCPLQETYEPQLHSIIESKIFHSFRFYISFQGWLLHDIQMLRHVLQLFTVTPDPTMGQF